MKTNVIISLAILSLILSVAVGQKCAGWSIPLGGCVKVCGKDSFQYILINPYFNKPPYDEVRGKRNLNQECSRLRSPLRPRIEKNSQIMIGR